jgi:hypothetical protein
MICCTFGGGLNAAVIQKATFSPICSFVVISVKYHSRRISCPNAMGAACVCPVCACVIFCETSPADPSKSKSLPHFIKGGGVDSLLQIWTVMSQNCQWSGVYPSRTSDSCALEAASRNKHNGVVALLLENGARS